LPSSLTRLKNSAKEITPKNYVPKNSSATPLSKVISKFEPDKEKK
jgi:hypothetical protein